MQIDYHCPTVRGAKVVHAEAYSGHGMHIVRLYADHEAVASFEEPSADAARALAEQLNGGPKGMTEEELLRGLDSLTATTAEAAE